VGMWVLRKDGSWSYGRKSLSSKDLGGILDTVLAGKRIEMFKAVYSMPKHKGCNTRLTITWKE
jgi:hypothetical protein